jgi:type II secretory pathway pseudopilin PulG
MRPSVLHSQRGITLIDTIVVTALIGVLMAMTVPAVLGSLDSMRLGQSGREVEREIQLAKSRAVTKGRPIRIRFNCPTTGSYRVTELIGTPSVPVTADDAANRCDPQAYPYPPADNNPLTLPNLDGPVRTLGSGVTFLSSQVIEFWPDGTAHYRGPGTSNPWPLIPTTGITISMQRDGKRATISVNGLGKIVYTQ